jgi:hypothetical protein
MKRFLNALYEISLSIGQAKAASALVRAGMYAEAKELMAGK